MTGTPIVIGFYPESQSPVDERFLKDGVPYTDTADVLASIPTGSRSAGLFVNIAGVLYWFLEDLITLEPVVGTLSLANGSVTLVKMAAMNALSVIGNPTNASGTPQYISIEALKVLLCLQGNNTGDQNLSNYVVKINGKSLSTEDFTTEMKNWLSEQSGVNTGDETEQTILEKLGVDDVVQSSDLTNLVAKVTGKDLIAITEIERLANMKQGTFVILLPAATDITVRLAGTVVAPLGWTMAAVGEGGNSLQITHNLTGVTIDHVSVKATGLTGNQMLVPFKDAYSGILELENVVTLNGLAHNDLPLIIILTFA